MRKPIFNFIDAIDKFLQYYFCRNFQKVILRILCHTSSIFQKIINIKFVSLNALLIRSTNPIKLLLFWFLKQTFLVSLWPWRSMSCRTQKSTFSLRVGYLMLSYFFYIFLKLLAYFSCNALLLGHVRRAIFCQIVLVSFRTLMFSYIFLWSFSSYNNRFL